MQLTVQCDDCGQKFLVAAEFAGRKARCSVCKKPVQIPSAEPASAPAPDSAVVEAPVTEAFETGPADAKVADAAIDSTTAEIAEPIDVTMADVVVPEAIAKVAAADVGAAAIPNPPTVETAARQSSVNSKLKRIGSLVATAIRGGWSLTARMVRFYIDQRAALRRRFIEYTVSGEKSFNREREIRLSDTKRYETAHRDEAGWQIQLADCCVVCGKAAEGDWETQSREIPDVTVSLWLPIVGLPVAIGLGWYWGSVLAFAVIWLASFFAGYLLCRSVSVQLRLRRCGEHASFTSSPQVYLLGDDLAMRMGHVSVRKAFFEVNRGSDAAEIPDNASISHPYAKGKFRQPDAPRREPATPGASPAYGADRLCGSCQKQIPNTKPTCPWCLATLSESRRTIVAALKEYEANPPRQYMPPSKADKVVTGVTKWGLTAGAFLVNPAVGLVTAAKVMSDGKQEKRAEHSGLSPDHDRSDVVTLRNRGYPLYSSVSMKQLIGPIVNSDTESLCKLVTSESDDLARGALLGLVDSDAEVLTVFAALAEAVQSKQITGVRTKALELLGTLGLERELLTPVYLRAALDEHEPISSLAAKTLQSWGMEVPQPGQQVEVTAENVAAENLISAATEADQPIPLADTAATGAATEGLAPVDAPRSAAPQQADDGNACHGETVAEPKERAEGAAGFELQP